MLSKKIEEALNAQINAELYSAYIYLAMSAYFESKDLPGMAAWMRAQNDEEVAHAMKIFTYIIDRGGRVTLDAIDKPQAEWASPLAVFENAYKHEQHVTSLIHKLVALTIAEDDYATKNMLDWFVDEQVEEEAAAAAIVAKLKMIGDHVPALIMLDKELGSRQVGAE
ncbi:MAG TPA: ferritin [Gemmatimonadota bacterium]|nr:ferritin [Gemmatimonadota bacterium]